MDEDIKISERFHESSMEWVKDNEYLYRIFPMSTLKWNSFIVGKDKEGVFSIEDTLIACSNNGGPIAIVNRKGRAICGSTNMLKDYLLIFNTYGKCIAKLIVSS